MYIILVIWELQNISAGYGRFQAVTGFFHCLNRFRDWTGIWSTYYFRTIINESNIEAEGKIKKVDCRLTESGRRNSYSRTCNADVVFTDNETQKEYYVYIESNQSESDGDNVQLKYPTMRGERIVYQHWLMFGHVCCVFVGSIFTLVTVFSSDNVAAGYWISSFFFADTTKLLVIGEEPSCKQMKHVMRW